jgi:hypothetical protein
MSSIKQLAFFETNTFNECLDRQFSSLDIKNLLMKKNLILISNPHSIYEILKTAENNPIKCQNLFRYTKELDITFCCNTAGLLLSEIDNLINNTPINYILSTYLKDILDSAIDQYSRNQVCYLKIEEIKTLEDEIKEDNIYSLQPRTLTRYLKKNSWEKTIDDFLKEENVHEIISYVKQRTKKTISENKCLKLIENQNSFPALINTIKGDLYLNHAYANKRKPYKLLNDLRHIIDSSYCMYFITNDKNLKKIMNGINPQIDCKDLAWLIK